MSSDLEGLSQRQIAVVASTSVSNIGVWDIQTGTCLTTYKSNNSACHGLRALGRDYFLAYQSGKAQNLQFWCWNKDQIHLRSSTPEQIGSVATSRGGTYCAVGSLKGNILIWECASGKLLKVWPAHYKAITVLEFTNDSSCLVSGGEDAMVAFWLLMDILDASSHNQQQGTPQPHFSWSEHTLPVRGLYMGLGRANPIVASASSDRTCKIWSVAEGCLLRSISLPCALLSITADAWEHSLYLGGSDGRIFEVSLVRQPEVSSSFAGANQKVADLQEKGIVCLSGHSAAVTGLSVTLDGYKLVSGSEDETLRVWHVQSRQTLRVINIKGAISAVLVLPKPLHMTSGRADSGKKGAARLQPLAQFNKFVDPPGAGNFWEGPPVILDGSHGYSGEVVSTVLFQAAPPEAEDAGEILQNRPGGSADEILAKEKAELVEQLESATKTIADLQAMNAKLHSFVVESANAE